MKLSVCSASFRLPVVVLLSNSRLRGSPAQEDIGTRGGSSFIYVYHSNLALIGVTVVLEPRLLPGNTLFDFQK